MDQRVNILALEPQIERNIGVPGDTREIVILRVSIAGIAALWLHSDDGLAAPNRGEAECPIMGLRIILGSAPGFFEILPQYRRKLFQFCAIFGKAEIQYVLAQRMSQRMPALDIETGYGKVAQQGLDRGQCVEPHRMRDLMRTAGVARQEI